MKLVGYMSGGISQSDDAGASWKSKLASLVSDDVRLIDPMEKGNVADLADLKGLFRALRDGSLVNEMRLRWMVRDIIIPMDCEKVLSSDFVVLRDYKDVRIWGSICECFLAYRNNIPVFIITDREHAELNAWEIGVSSFIFKSEEEFAGFINECGVVCRGEFSASQRVKAIEDRIVTYIHRNVLEDK